MENCPTSSPVSVKSLIHYQECMEIIHVLVGYPINVHHYLKFVLSMIWPSAIPEVYSNKQNSLRGAVKYYFAEQKVKHVCQRLCTRETERGCQSKTMFAKDTSVRKTLKGGSPRALIKDDVCIRLFLDCCQCPT